jgi:hypothetical protein
MLSLRSLLIVSVVVLLAYTGRGQTVAGLPENPANPGYNPQTVFAPGFYSDVRLPSRSANGAPAPGYWQY